MIQLLLYIAVFVLGVQMAFGKLDESKLKLKPGQTIEEVKKKQKNGGYILMILPFVSFFIQLFIISSIT